MEQANPLQSADWYLVANNGRLSVRIRERIRFGVDDRGLLAVQATGAASAAGLPWVTLHVEPDGLSIEAIATGWALEAEDQWVADGPGVLLPPGTVVDMGGHAVYVGHDLQSGRIEQRVSMVEVDVVDYPADATIVGPVAEPGAAAGDKARRASAEDTVFAVGSEADATRTSPDAVDPDATRIAPPITSGDTWATVPEPPLLDRRVPRRRSVRSPIALALLAGALVLAGVFAMERWPEVLGGLAGAVSKAVPDDLAATEAAADEAELAALDSARSETGTSFEPSPIAPAPPREVATPALAEAGPAAPTASWVETGIAVGDAVRDETDGSSEMGPGAAEVEPVEATEVSDPELGLAPEIPPQVDDAASAPLDIDAHLARARTLLDAGYVSWPEENASQLLGEILAADPQHEVALAMLDEAAAVNLEEARRAYEDGFEEGAIRALMEILVFHPNYAPARAQLSAWREG